MRQLVLCSLLSLGVLSGCGGQSARESFVIDRSIGAVTIKESRAKVEHDIGKGTVVSSKLDRSARPEPLLEEAVGYKSAGLVVWYVSNTHHAPIATIVETMSPRYRTSSGIGIGTSVERLKKVGVECNSGGTCQHFHGHNQPGTLFRLTSPGGKVARIVIVAAVD